MGHWCSCSRSDACSAVFVPSGSFEFRRSKPDSGIRARFAAELPDTGVSDAICSPNAPQQYVPHVLQPIPALPANPIEQAGYEDLWPNPSTLPAAPLSEVRSAELRLQHLRNALNSIQTAGNLDELAASISEQIRSQSVALQKLRLKDKQRQLEVLERDIDQLQRSVEQQDRE